MEEGFSRPSGQPWQRLGRGKVLGSWGDGRGAGIAGVERGKSRGNVHRCLQALRGLPWCSGPCSPWKTLVFEQKAAFLGVVWVLASCILFYLTVGCLFCPPLCAGGREATPSGKLCSPGPEGTRRFQDGPLWSWYLHEIPSSGETQAHCTLENATKGCCKCPPGCWVIRVRKALRCPLRPRRAV